MREHWPTIQGRLIERVDPHGEVFDGRTFKADRWTKYLIRHDIAWPRLPSGKLALDDETFRQMAKRHPKLVGKWRELRHTLGQMRLTDLCVGSDGRNRTLLSPFQSRTGRNQPSNSRFIFGPSAWLRSLIKPSEGRAIAYVDWSQQEFGIAAAFSQDDNMRKPIARVTRIWHLQSKPMRSLPMPPNIHTRRSERYSRRVRWASNTEWGPSLCPMVSVNRRCWTGIATAPPSNVSKVLAMVRVGGRPCDVVPIPSNRIRLAVACWIRREPEIFGELPMPG